MQVIPLSLEDMYVAVTLMIAAGSVTWGNFPAEDNKLFLERCGITEETAIDLCIRLGEIVFPLMAAQKEAENEGKPGEAIANQNK